MVLNACNSSYFARMTYWLTGSIHVHYSQFKAVKSCVYEACVCVKFSGTAKCKSIL